MGLDSYTICLLFFVCIQLQLYVAGGEVMDVDTGPLDTSFTYTAETDSQQLEYRCVREESADGLVWRYNNQEYTNPLSPYLFYGAVGTVGTFYIDCYHVSERLGAMSLTITDGARLLLEYSGVREVYSPSSGGTHTATIPLDTSVVRITCEITRGSIQTPMGLTEVTTDPSVTLSLTNTSGEGDYTCYRNIFQERAYVMSLKVQTPYGPLGISQQQRGIIAVAVLMLLVLLAVSVVVVLVVVVLLVYLYRRHGLGDNRHTAVKMTQLKEIPDD